MMRILPCVTILFLSVTMFCSHESVPKEYTFYIGTYTRGESQGIYQGRLDTENGTISLTNQPVSCDNPSFLALSPDQSTLYAVNEISHFKGTGSGAVTAFTIAPRSHGLTRLNQGSSYGAHPCHITIDASGQYALVANYNGSNAVVLSISDSGKVGGVANKVTHEGFGPNPRRQQGPHPHSVTFSPDGNFVMVADLGIDQVRIYRWDSETGRLARPEERMAFFTRPGAGPRHFVFHPDQEFAYVINELQSTMTALKYDADKGILTDIQTVSTLPKGFQGRNTAADIHISNEGRFLYGSNRGHNSIAVFRIDESNGKLTSVQHPKTRGKVPRNFSLDPSGKYLLVANQGSDSVTLFHIDRDSGRLTPLGKPLYVPDPVCIRFLDSN